MFFYTYTSGLICYSICLFRSATADLNRQMLKHLDSSLEECPPVLQAAGVRSRPRQVSLRMLYGRMERALVKSLHSGDPDVIQTRGLQVPDYLGAKHLQVPDQG